MSISTGFKLDSLGYGALKRQLSDHDTRLLSLTFHEADAGNKGFLSREDLKVAMVMLFGYKPSKSYSVGKIGQPISEDPSCECGHPREDADHLFLQLPKIPSIRETLYDDLNKFNYEVDRLLQDLKNSSELTLETFMVVVGPKMFAIDEDSEIRQSFMAFDAHCRGFLTLDDAKRVFSEVAPHLPVHTTETAFRELDRDGDGRISYKDFEFMMKFDSEDS